MHKTKIREKIKTLKDDARVLERQAKVLEKIPKMKPAMKLRQEEADRLRAQAEDLKDQARLEDLKVWKMKKTKSVKSYTYWMSSWREDDKVRNVHLGSTKKINAQEALQKAKKMKTEALGLMTNHN